MEVETDTGGDAANMDMDLDNVELLDQHPSTISSGRDGRWLYHQFLSSPRLYLPSRFRTWTKGGGQIQPTELQGNPPASPQPTRPTLAEQSIRALIEFGIIVSSRKPYKNAYLTTVDQPGGCGNHGGLDVHGDGGSGVAVRPRVREVEGVLQLPGASSRY